MKANGAVRGGYRATVLGGGEMRRREGKEEAGTANGVKWEVSNR